MRLTNSCFFILTGQSGAHLPVRPRYQRDLSVGNCLEVARYRLWRPRL